MLLERSGVRCAALLLLMLCLWVPSAYGLVRSPADVRLPGLGLERGYFAAGPGRVLAGGTAVYTTPDQIFGWSLTTGRYRPLGKPPKLGTAQNDLTDGGGFLRVESATASRIVIARGEGSALNPGLDSGSGHRLRVGPPRGPFGDPAGCGERSGRPADLDDDLLAYVAAPAPRPKCPPGVVSAARDPAIVVRNLAQGNDVVLTRGVPFDGAVRQLEVRGNFLAYSLATGPDDEGGSGKPEVVQVIDLRSGRTLLSLAPSRSRAWALLSDGSIASGRVRLSTRGGRCLGSLKSFRRYRPNAPPTAMPALPCSLGAVIPVGDEVLYSRVVPGGRAEVVGVGVTGAIRSLGVFSGPLVDASDRHLLVSDDTCTGDDLRVVPAALAPTARPAGPRTCPFAVRSRRRVRAGETLKVRVRCRLGCRIRYDWRYYPRGKDVVFGQDDEILIRRGKSRTLRFDVPHERKRSGAGRAVLALYVENPARRPTKTVRRLRVLPAKPGTPTIQF